jgi:hypothetical protein
MWVGVGRKPPTQDVADHGCPACPGLIPRPHRGLVDLFIAGGQVEYFPANDMIDERLLHGGQFPARWGLSDHTGTLINAV